MANDELRIEEHLPSVPVTPERTATPHNTTAPATQPPPPAETTADASPARTTLFAQMKAEDQSWAWKFIARCCICLVDIIAIACIGALIANANRINSNPYLGVFEDSGVFPYCLIAIGVSFVWCLVAILVRLFRRPPRPVHPGLAVGVDLVLWLSFIIIVLAGIFAAISLKDFGSDPTDLYDPTYYHNNYDGHYILAPNGTWVYVITSTDSSSQPVWNATSGQYDYPPVDVSNVTRDCTPMFDSCAEQDAYINELWQLKPTRYALDITTIVCEALALVLHFALFVQACVDTHKRNQRKKMNMVSSVLQDMEQRGLITIHGNQPRQGMNEKMAYAPPPPSAARFA